MQTDRDLLLKVVAGLRETAAKCEQRRVVITPPVSMMVHGVDTRFPSEDHEVDRYSRDWIMGRLAGMADMIEVLCDLGPEA